MVKRSWIQYVGLYLLWAVVIALGFWLLLVSRETFLFGASFYVGDDIVRGWQVRFFDKAFFIIAGLFIIILVTTTEGYFRGGVEKGNLLRRFAEVAGIEVLIIFACDLLLALMQGAAASGWVRWLIIAAELLLGVVLFLFGRANSKTKV